LTEGACASGASPGLAVWREGEAGPSQAIPHPGPPGPPRGHPGRQPHGYVRGGTARVLTLSRPADGRVRVEGAAACPSAVPRPWLRRGPGATLAELPAPPPAADASRAARVRRQAGLTMPVTPPERLPPWRVPLVLGNLAGRPTPGSVLWRFARGVVALFTPLGGSWRDTAASTRWVLKRRALGGQRPASPGEIIGRFGAVAGHGSAAPTPFEWGGPRAARREGQRERRHAVGGSGACTRQPIRRCYGHGRGK
jgi:hypothetical protein